jgi:predicted metal-binding membrane protein
MATVQAFRRPAPSTHLPVVAGLLALAAVGWWWSAHTSGDMTTHMGMGMTSMSLAAFLVAWVAMMAAMMFPAIVPVVRLYAKAADRGHAVPTPLFVGGYLVVWSVMGVPAYLAWRALQAPLADGRTWVAYFAGSVLAAAALYQLSPLKNACLRHCRSPLSFFLRQGANLKTPLGAVRAGATHGLVCLGCCWALMAVLIALGTMNLAWMVGLAALIFLEKATRAGRAASVVAALAFLVLGAALWVHPHLLTTIT